MKLNTNSNIYTIVYASVLVVIVAFLLAFVYQSLKDKQDANVKLDTKKQILYSLNIRGLADEEAEARYDEVVKEEKEINGKQLYICEIDGQPKYVLTLKGMGLWGGISGFLSVNADKKTVYGAYFNHEGETAGLGAEIKDSQEWQEKFRGKQLFAEDGSIAIAVKKKVQHPESEVDAVTGATLTSDGVSLMLQKGIEEYQSFLTEE